MCAARFLKAYVPHKSRFVPTKSSPPVRFSVPSSSPCIQLSKLASCGVHVMQLLIVIREEPLAFFGKIGGLLERGAVSVLEANGLDN